MLRYEMLKIGKGSSSADKIVGWLFDWLFCFTTYQPISGYLTPNHVILIKVYMFQDLLYLQIFIHGVLSFRIILFSDFQILNCFCILLYCLHICWSGLSFVWFDGTLTIVGYLCQIHFYSYKQFYFKQLSLI